MLYTLLGTLRIMKKIYIREYDAAGVVINQFEVIPSEKNKTGRSRIYVETDDENYDRILGFKLYDDYSLEILEQKTTPYDFDEILTTLTEKIEVNQNNVSIALKEFKLDSFTQTIKFKELTKHIEKILEEITPHLSNDNLIIAHTPIVKYDGKPYQLGGEFHNISDITSHINSGNRVLLYSPKIIDDEIQYASILL